MTLSGRNARCNQKIRFLDWSPFDWTLGKLVESDGNRTFRGYEAIIREGNQVPDFIKFEPDPELKPSFVIVNSVFFVRSV